VKKAQLIAFSPADAGLSALSEKNKAPFIITVQNILKSRLFTTKAEAHHHVMPAKEAVS
jgi:hypothetical protein